jgi:hypothetical protein
MESSMSSLKWGLFLGLGITIDLAQAGLSAFGIGLVINRVFDPVIAALFWLIFKLNGISWQKGGQLDKTRVFAFGVGFLIEMIGIGDFLPTWTAQIVIAFLTDKANSLVGQMGSVSEVLEKIPSKKQILPPKLS